MFCFVLIRDRSLLVEGFGPLLDLNDPRLTASQSKRRNQVSLLSCPNLCPACPLRSRNSLASCRRNSSLFPTRFPPAQVDFPERCEGRCYAVQFILKSLAFLLELAHYRLHQCLWHPASLTPAFEATVVPTEAR